jgi:ribosome maturation factor RimP
MMYEQTVLPQVEALARKCASAHGLDVAWVELKRERGGWLLRVFLDREEGSIGLEDCQVVSERLSLLLDVEDPIDGSYTLEVSSPGLDRPLWRERDYRRFAGRKARLTTKEPVEGRRRFSGRLLGVEGEQVVLEQDGKRQAIPLALLESGRLEVELGFSGGRKRW